MFKMPVYHAPDFAREPLASAPNARVARVVRDGVAPEGFHSTSMFPEYVKVDGAWCLAKQSRMDASMVVAHDDAGAPFIRVVENRNLKQGFQRARSGHAESIAWRCDLPATRSWQYLSWRGLESGMSHVAASMGQMVYPVSLLGCLALRVRRQRQDEARYDDGS